MNIAFIGTGYVGLTSSVIMCYIGHQVVCVDNDNSKIEILKTGNTFIYEKDLDAYLKKCLESNHLLFSSNLSDCINSDVIFITVGTPSKESGEADLSQVYKVIDDLCSIIKHKVLIVIKSTVPPKTSVTLQEYVSKRNECIEVAMCPEFLREGNAIYDSLNPHRVVIGANSEESRSLLLLLYKYFSDNGVDIVVTDTTTAEMIKYASNCFLATKISFINEMSNLCEALDADVNMLSLGMGLDKRIGSDFLNPGPGFGGSCFPKDILALKHISKTYQVPLKIVDALEEANNTRYEYLANKIKNILDSEPNSDKILGVLGLTYKSETDDIRNSPAIAIIEILLELGYTIKSYDPKGIINSKNQMNSNSIEFCENAEMVFQSTSAVIIMTEWYEFKNIDFRKLSNTMKCNIIIDYRNLLDNKLLKSFGFRHIRLGFKDH